MADLGGLIPLAQEFEDALLIVGGMMCAFSLALTGKQKMGMLSTGGLIVVVTLIVTIATFKAGAT